MTEKKSIMCTEEMEESDADIAFKILLIRN